MSSKQVEQLQAHAWWQPKDQQNVVGKWICLPVQGVANNQIINIAIQSDTGFSCAAEQSVLQARAHNEAAASVLMHTSIKRQKQQPDEMFWRKIQERW